MYQVKFTAAFKKKYKLMKKRNLDLTSLDNVIDKRRQGIPLEKKHKDHGLNVTSNRIGYSYISLKTIQKFIIYSPFLSKLNILSYHHKSKA